MTNEYTLQQELTQIYLDFYVEGFKHNDIGLIDKIVQYPLTYIKNGKVISCSSYPIDPLKLKTELGWDHSENWQFSVVAVNETEAHLTASAQRCRKDGSVIEKVHGFYAFTKTNEGWRMFALADITY